MSKTRIFSDIELSKELRKKGRKTVSHGTFRAKRHPTSPRVKQT